MTINEFLTSCNVNSPKLAEYLKKKYFVKNEIPHRREQSNYSAHTAKTFGDYSVVLMKTSWWSSGSGIGRSNFFLAVTESTGQVYCSPEIDFRDQYDENKDRPWLDFHEIINLEVIDKVLLVNVADFRGNNQCVVLKLEGSSEYDPMLYAIDYTGQFFWKQPSAKEVRSLMASYSANERLLVREWRVSVGTVCYWPGLFIGSSAKSYENLKSFSQVIKAVEEACLENGPCEKKHIGLEIHPVCVSLEKLLGKGGD